MRPTIEDIAVVLHPEDIKKLNNILAKVNSGIEKAREKMTDDFVVYLHGINIEPELYENTSDKIAVTVIFLFNFEIFPFSISKKSQRVFHLDCVSPDIEYLAEKKFTEVTRDYIQKFCNFLYSSADQLQNALHP